MRRELRGGLEAEREMGEGDRDREIELRIDDGKHGEGRD
jgi:hypothetical protein